MSFWKKHSLHLGAVLGSATLLLGCATYVHPGTTLYWSGKSISDFMFNKGLTPDSKKICREKDSDNPFLIYGFAKPIYNVFEREVGRGYHAFGTTIYTQKERQFTGDYSWTYIFTDLEGKITSHRSETGFGNLDKEFNCHDMDEALNDDNKLVSLSSKQSLWMSIVGSPNNTKMMWPSDKAYTSQKEAEQDALKQCHDEGNATCNVAISYSNLCISSAIGVRNGSYFDAFGFGLNKDYSNKDAIEQCESNGGSSCQTVVEGLCATACDMVKDQNCVLPPPQILTQSGKFF